MKDIQTNRYNLNLFDTLNKLNIATISSKIQKLYQKKNTNNRKYHMPNKREKITIYTGTTCIHHSKESAVISIYLYCVQQPENSISEISTKPFYTYNKTSLYAINRALLNFKQANRALVVVHNSDYIDRLITKYNSIIDNDNEEALNNMVEANKESVKELFDNFKYNNDKNSTLEISSYFSYDTEFLNCKNEATKNLILFLQDKKARSNNVINF